MKILSEEKILLEQRRDDCFSRFLERCSDAYADSFVGYFCNPYKWEEWQDQSKEKLPQTPLKIEGSTETCVRTEYDPVERNKYAAD
jgi:hypothetical protein